MPIQNTQKKKENAIWSTKSLINVLLTHKKSTDEGPRNGLYKPHIHLTPAKEFQVAAARSSHPLHYSTLPGTTSQAQAASPFQNPREAKAPGTPPLNVVASRPVPRATSTVPDSHGGRRSSAAAAPPLPDAARGGAPRARGLPLLDVLPRAVRGRCRAPPRGVAPPQRPLRLRPWQRHRAPPLRAVETRPLRLFQQPAADEHGQRNRHSAATAGRADRRQRQLPCLRHASSYAFWHLAGRSRVLRHAGGSTACTHGGVGGSSSPSSARAGARGRGVRGQAGGAREQAGARAEAEQVGEDGPAAGAARRVARAAALGVGERAAAAVVRDGARRAGVLGHGRRGRVPAHGGGVHREADAVPPRGVHGRGRPGRRRRALRRRRGLRGRRPCRGRIRSWRALWWKGPVQST